MLYFSVTFLKKSEKNAYYLKSALKLTKEVTTFSTF